jgi:hypothetical protein
MTEPALPAKTSPYAVRFVVAARSKLTTYVALATAGLTELVSSWDQAAALLPTWVVTHKSHIFAASTLVTIWTRIRREL